MRSPVAKLELIHHGMVIERDADPVELSEVDIDGNLSEGEPERFTLRNAGGSMIREITVGLDGPGRQNVQLAVDEDEGPGVWAAPGEEILVFQGALPPGEEVAFWSRGIYSPEDSEGGLEFDFLLGTVAA
jgi:hypothetical protein